MTETIVALAVIVTIAGIVVVDYLAYLREHEAKRQKKEYKEKLDEEVHTGGSISRISHLAGRVRD